MKSFLLAGLLSLLLAIGPADARERWKLASAVPSALPISGAYAKDFAKRVRDETGRALSLHHFEPRALVPTRSIVEALLKGSVESAWLPLSMLASRDVRFLVFDGPPFGLAPAAHAAWLVEPDIRASLTGTLADQGLAGYACTLTGSMGVGWATKELGGPEAAGSLRVAADGIVADLWRNLGAKVSGGSPSQRYLALASDRLDLSAVGPVYEDDRRRLYQTAKRFYYPGPKPTASVYAFLTSETRWAGLDRAVRDKVRDLCDRLLSNAVGEDKILAEEAFNDLRSRSVAVAEPPAALVSAFEREWTDRLAGLRREDAAFGRLWERYPGPDSD